MYAELNVCMPLPVPLFFLFFFKVFSFTSKKQKNALLVNRQTSPQRCQLLPTEVARGRRGRYQWSKVWPPSFPRSHGYSVSNVIVINMNSSVRKESKVLCRSAMQYQIWSGGCGLVVMGFEELVCLTSLLGLTLPLPRSLCCRCNSFTKESCTKVKPARNIHLF